MAEIIYTISTPRVEAISTPPFNFHLTFHLLCTVGSNYRRSFQAQFIYHYALCSQGEVVRKNESEDVTTKNRFPLSLSKCILHHFSNDFLCAW